MEDGIPGTPGAVDISSWSRSVDEFLALWILQVLSVPAWWSADSARRSGKCSPMQAKARFSRNSASTGGTDLSFSKIGPAIDTQINEGSEGKSEATMNPPDICHPSSSSTDDKVRRSLLLGSALWLSACSLSIWYCTWDDSYIIFRYAQNLMRGLGLVYNAGQKVEGYTSFLWVLLLTVGTRLMHDPIVAAKVLGLLFNLSTLLAGYCLCRQMIIDKVPMYGLALVLTASNTYFIVGTVGGLESPLFSSILCWSVVAYLEGDPDTHLKSQTYWCVGTSLLLTLLVLTRPDGVITFFLLCCDAGWRFRKRPGNIACLSAFLWSDLHALLLWRWHYYGLFFPNTFYVKRGERWLYWHRA